MQGFWIGFGCMIGMSCLLGYSLYKAMLMVEDEVHEKKLYKERARANDWDKGDESEYKKHARTNGENKGDKSGCVLNYSRRSKMQPVEKIDWTKTLNETSFDPPMPPAKGISGHNLKFKDMDSYNAIKEELGIADWTKRNILGE